MTVYEVTISDRAEQDIDDFYFNYQGRIGFDKAYLWYTAIRAAIIEELSFEPYRYQVSEEGSAAYPGTDVRTMRYGQGTAIFRVFYFVLEPRIDEGETEGTVRVLRVRHSAMRPLNQHEEE